MQKGNGYLLVASILTFAAFAAAIYIAIKLPQINLLRGAPPEKVIEFEGTRLCGWKDGKKQWEITAEKIWYTKNQGMTSFEKVKDGVLYRKGRAVVKGLRASLVKYNKWTEEIEAFSSPPEATGEAVPLQAFVDVANTGSKERSPKKARFVFFSADRLSYSTKTEKAEASGSVRIDEGNLGVFAEKMETAGKDGAADLRGNVLIKKKDTRIRSEKMRADFAADRYSFFGDVEIAQKEKAAVCETATLENKTGEMRLHGGVKFLIEKASALVNDATVKTLHNPRAKESLKEKTLLTCNALDLSTDGRDAKAFGAVEITQKGKRARSDAASYDGKSEEISMTGNVYFEKEGEWLKAQKVLISVSGESFGAVGQVEAEFKIKK